MSKALAPMSEADARDLTDRINNAAGELWRLLLESYEREAWRALGYPNWHEYAGAEFSVSKSYAYRLLKHGKVLAALMEESVSDQSPIGDSVPEAQTRELAKLDTPEEQREAWREAVETAPKDSEGKPKVTAAHVADVVATRKDGSIDPLKTMRAQREAAVESPAPDRVPSRRPYTPKLRAFISAAVEAATATEDEVKAIPVNDFMLAHLRTARDLLDRVIETHTAHRETA